MFDVWKDLTIDFKQKLSILKTIINNKQRNTYQLAL